MTGWLVRSLCRVARSRARMRCITRTIIPARAWPPWRSRSSCRFDGEPTGSADVLGFGTLSYGVRASPKRGSSRIFVRVAPRATRQALRGTLTSPSCRSRSAPPLIAKGDKVTSNCTIQAVPRGCLRRAINRISGALRSILTFMSGVFNIITLFANTNYFFLRCDLLKRRCSLCEQ